MKKKFLPFLVVLTCLSMLGACKDKTSGDKSVSLDAESQVNSEISKSEESSIEESFESKNDEESSVEESSHEESSKGTESNDSDEDSINGGNWTGEVPLK